MGGFLSRLRSLLSRLLSRPADPPLPPPPLFDTPWRDINWEDKQSALQYINNYTPKTEGRQLRILLHGPAGAGKSSFINSVCSVLEGGMRTKARVDNSTDCCTIKYETYKIQKGNQDTFYLFVLSDSMGLKNTGYRSRRTHVKDVKRMMKGHVRDGYTFNPECKIPKDNPYYNANPAANDKVDILVCVIDANKVSQMAKEDVETIREIRDEATELEIPQVAILTKVDAACPEIKEDVKNVYRSKNLKSKMELFSAEVGIPMNCIFPVKNYHEEVDLDSDTDSLILNTLKHIINSGEELKQQ